ncbi:hypothetical protein [Collimonas fungivorans]|uniref:hypothetical protein n=1 Tax=Collimonas fungivorans TaxID=158899 RepID=UPI0026F01285|nr:hypothetical protein [Collimonas fungivorans]
MAGDNSCKNVRQILSKEYWRKRGRRQTLACLYMCADAAPAAPCGNASCDAAEASGAWLCGYLLSLCFVQNIVKWMAPAIHLRKQRHKKTTLTLIQPAGDSAVPNADGWKCPGQEKSLQTKS